MKGVTRPRSFVRAALVASLVLGAVAVAAPSALGQDVSSSPAGNDESGGGGGTTAVAINTRDDSNVFRFAFAIKRTMQDVVDTSNAAAAVSSCSECQTVAVSFQAVLIMSDPSVVAPENLAIALNVDCSSCETMASAYQFVMTTDGPVHFTAAGNRALAELRRTLAQLLRSDASLAELHAAFEEIASRLAEILATETVAAGRPDGAATESMTPSASPSPEATESPPPSTSPSPSASIEPSPAMASPTLSPSGA